MNGWESVGQTLDQVMSGPMVWFFRLLLLGVWIIIGIGVSYAMQFLGSPTLPVLNHWNAKKAALEKQRNQTKEDKDGQYCGFCLSTIFWPIAIPFLIVTLSVFWPGWYMALGLLLALATDQEKAAYRNSKQEYLAYLRNPPPPKPDGEVEIRINGHRIE